jgi:hypothetical protein
MGSAPSSTGIVIGRYVLYDEIASGGMASVHIGRLLGPAGFSRTVAIKRLHAHYAKDPAFVAMFLDEARLAARVRHPNVVSTLDVETKNAEIFLVMDYIQGESLSKLLRAAREAGAPVPGAVASAILGGVLYGLDAAHDATDEGGRPLRIVHRDVSPQNVLVGVDGISRVVDFGIAKAMARLQTTAEGQVKGKLAYMSPEQLRQGHLDRRADVFAASIVLWELLAGERLFTADDPSVIALNVIQKEIPRLRGLRSDLPAAIDDVVLRGLAREAGDRFATARDMVRALEHALPPASPAVTGDWVRRFVGRKVEERAARIGEIESTSAPLSAVESGVVASPADPIARAEEALCRAAMPTVPVGMSPTNEREEARADAEANAPVTQVTDASLVTPIRKKGEHRTVAVFAFGLAALGAVALVFGLRRGDAPSPAPQATPSSQPVATADEPPSTTSAAPPPSEHPSVASSAPPAIPSSTPRASAPPEGPKRRARPTSNCDPPYVFDAVRQIRVYKKECQ